MMMRGIIFMNLALIFYTWAVFSGRRHGLHTKHLIIFGIGLLCDYLGTMEMSRFALLHGKAPQWHHVAGIASLAGMAFHFMLALIASILKRTETVNRVFHRVSLTIYTAWLGAFITGSIAGMMRLN
jgi:uncharacterized repeat protein (TIGR03987 family)